MMTMRFYSRHCIQAQDISVCILKSECAHFLFAIHATMAAISAVIAASIAKGIEAPNDPPSP